MGQRYIVDEGGAQVDVVLDTKDYERLLKELEELRSICASSAAKGSGDDTAPGRAARERRIPYEQQALATYRVRLQATEEGYAVWCPGLPGCWSQGLTEEEALENIKNAIITYLAAVEELAEGQLTRLVEVP